MRDTLIGIAGILISVLTFAIAYRQTIGARQARAEAINRDIVDALLRRVVLEQVGLTADDIHHTVSGKAAEGGLPTSALRSVDAVVDLLYARILESDLVGKDERQRALSAVADLRKPAMDIARQQSSQRSPRETRRRLLVVVVIIAVFAALVGTAVFVVAQRGPAETGVPNIAIQFTLALTAVALAAVALIARTGPTVFRRSKERLGGTSPTLRELTTFPGETEGSAALTLLCQLSPFAIRNLYQLAEDEITSIHQGLNIGMEGDSETSLGLHELLTSGYIEPIPKQFRFKKEAEIYGLTSRGRSLARLLFAGLYDDPREKPPAYLRCYVEQRVVVNDDGLIGSGKLVDAKEGSKALNMGHASDGD